MSPKDSDPPPAGPHWLLRRFDQAVVAGLVLAATAATIGWWIAQGGLQGRLIEVDRAGPQTARFNVDINAADWPELAQVPGIGQTLAQRIVACRSADGPFADHDALRRRVRGIGPKTLESMRPYLRPMPPAADLAGK